MFYKVAVFLWMKNCMSKFMRHNKYLWTEKGALLHAKSLNTDKAWEVYDYLVDFYFRAKEKRPEKKEIVPVPAKTVEQVKEGYDIAPLF